MPLTENDAISGKSGQQLLLVSDGVVSLT